MTEMALIRRDIFKLTQSAFAVVIGVSQGTVSRWEAGEFEPNRDQLARIRDEARKRGLKWEDAWFFEAPSIAQFLQVSDHGVITP